MVMMLQEGGARGGRGSSQSLEASSTDEHLLGQLQSRVEAAVLEDKPLSPLEESLMKALNGTLDNTTLPALMKGHEDDQKDMDRAVQALTNCNTNFDTDSKNAESAKRTVDAKKEAHRTCRGIQSKLNSALSEKKKDGEMFTDNLQQPQKPSPLPFLPLTVPDAYFAAGLSWLKEKEALYTQKKSAYTAAKTKHDNKRDICNAAQTSYESGYCQWIGKGTAASKSYTRCWEQGGGNAWNQTRASVLDSAERGSAPTCQ